MKKIILVLSTFLALASAHAQNNPNANPLVWGINAAASPIRVGDTTTTTFSIGNNGADPIPAGGATFNISFPPNVTVNQSTLNMNGGAAIFSASWTVMPGTGTFLTISVIGSGIPASTFMGPQVRFDMKVVLTGAVAGNAQQQTLNVANDASIAQNLNAGDDNANGPIQVVPATVLPITLESFTGVLSDPSTARLDWKVSHASQFSHFELERSNDGLKFSKIATLPYTQSDNYTSYDKTVSSCGAKALYRLRMVDNDGSFKLSDVVQIRLQKATQEISLFPNPASHEIRLEGLSGAAQVNIYSIDGRSMLQSEVTNAQAIDISTLPAGIYTVTIKDQQGNKSLKFTKS